MHTPFFSTETSESTYGKIGKIQKLCKNPRAFSGSLERFYHKLEHSHTCKPPLVIRPENNKFDDSMFYVHQRKNGVLERECYQLFIDPKNKPRHNHVHGLLIPTSPHYMKIGTRQCNLSPYGVYECDTHPKILTHSQAYKTFHLDEIQGKCILNDYRRIKDSRRALILTLNQNQLLDN